MGMLEYELPEDDEGIGSHQGQILHSQPPPVVKCSFPERHVLITVTVNMHDSGGGGGD